MIFFFFKQMTAYEIADSDWSSDVCSSDLEFDRICWLHTDGSVRGGITWDDICRLELPIPPIEKQLEIVNSYKAITERIALKKKINDNLAA